MKDAGDVNLTVAGHAVEDHIASKPGHGLLPDAHSPGQLHFRVERSEPRMIPKERKRVLKRIQKTARNLRVPVGKIAKGTSGIFSGP